MGARRLLIIGYARHHRMNAVGDPDVWVVRLLLQSDTSLDV